MKRRGGLEELDGLVDWGGLVVSFPDRILLKVRVGVLFRIVALW